ncbi:hypothetical protein N0V95_007474 [Ascochyta clinopodiicola]|nr:hypothetical protein N0V95_007474 [Ascochyta clinopodiicola]
MGDNSSRLGTFDIKDEPIENQRPMKVIVIGAGFSGIYTTIRLSQRLRNVSIQVYEQHEEVSGVWYIQDVAQSPVLGTRFGEIGEIIEDVANVVISAKGGLNQILWPNIKNLKTYQGKLIHSGAWDDSVNLTNKRIGVIGNGSSAIQIVPTIQKMEGTKVWNFARSPTWVSTSFGDTAMVQLGLNPCETKSDPISLPVSHRQQEHMARHPDHFHKMRKTLENEASSKHLFSLKNSQSQEIALVKFQDHMRQRLAGRPDLIEAIIPTFAPGCRRLTPGPGYLESLQQDNVTFCNKAIQEFNSTGLKLETEEQVDLDIVICATGYDAQAPPTFTVKGRNGTTLEERWEPLPESYLAITVDQFPNFFMIGGPNSNLGSGSLLSVFEAQGDYAVKIIRKLQKESYDTFEVRKERVADFSNYIDEYFKLTVYTDECSSWYRAHNDSNRIVALWPGSSLHCLEALRSPRWEDYIWESAEPSGNLLRWLGNGNTLVLSKGDPSWFIEERYLDVPKEEKPEVTEIYQQRPFSH